MVNECCGDTFEEACLPLSLSLSFFLCLFLSPCLSFSLSPKLFWSVCVSTALWWTFWPIFNFQPGCCGFHCAGYHTQSHAVGNAVSAILREEGKKKTKTCSFFLELRSVGASLVKIRITKQANKAEKSTSSPVTPVTPAAIVRHCSISSREPGRSWSLSYSNPVYASHLFLPLVDGRLLVLLN